MRFLFCFDYPVLRSTLGLEAKQFVYVSVQLRTIEWNPVTKDFRVLNAKKLEAKCKKGWIRFTTYTPRGQNEFAKSAEKEFKSSIIRAPLVYLYMDYDVHVQKALVQNIVLALGEIAVFQSKQKGLPERTAKLLNALSVFDDEYAPSFH